MNEKKFTGIGRRLGEERLRLGLNKSQMAQLGGVANSAYGNYENGERPPDAAFLAAIAAVGADVLFIITSQRAGHALADDEYKLLERYRSASKPVRAAIMGAATAQRIVKSTVQHGMAVSEAGTGYRVKPSD